MSSLISELSERRSAPAVDPEPRVLEFGGDDAEAVLAALASETGRQVLALLYDRPATPSEVADEVGTSLQNVHYHVDNLQEAGLVEGVDTRYSAKGNEMTVYAPASDPVVLTGGAGALEDLPGLAGVAALLAAAAAAVQVLAGRLVAPTRSADVVGPAGRLPASGGPLAGAADLLLEPGVMLLVGGIAALAALIVRRRLRGRR